MYVSYHGWPKICYVHVSYKHIHTSVLVLSTRWDLTDIVRSGPCPPKSPCRYSSIASMSCSVAKYGVHTCIGPSHELSLPLPIPTNLSSLLRVSHETMYMSLSADYCGAAKWILSWVLAGVNGPGREQFVKALQRPPSRVHTYLHNLRIQTYFSKIDSHAIQGCRSFAIEQGKIR